MNWLRRIWTRGQSSEKYRKTKENRNKPEDIFELPEEYVDAKESTEPERD